MEKPETNYVEASAASMEEGLTPERQTSLFLGVCCDMRRATIIVNIADISLSLLSLMGFIIMGSSAFASVIEDDAVQEQLAYARQFVWLSILFFSLSILTSLCGIMGALRFNGALVLISALWHCLSTITSFLVGDYLPMLLPILFAYPHFVLYKEIRQGTMTAESYAKERHSCCCV